MFFKALPSAIIDEDVNDLNRQNGGIDGGLADKIINVIRQDSTVTVAQIAEITQTPKRTVEQEMKKMRDTGKLVRNGGNRFGRWEIKDN